MFTAYYILYLKRSPFNLHWNNGCNMFLILHGAKCILHGGKESRSPELLLYWEEKYMAAILSSIAIEKRVKRRH